jgi:adenylyltransferase/sulfurtransferase
MLQATEALKLLLGIGEPLIGKLMLYDGLTARLQQIRLSKRPDCPVCGSYHAQDRGKD